MKTLDEQFPPTLPASVNTIATFIPSRSPEFKIHNSQGLAHNALGGRGFDTSRAKYELIDGEWKRTWAYVPPKNCRRCNRLYSDVYAEQQRQQQGQTRGWYSIRRYHHDPTYKGPKWSEEPICKICAVEIPLEKEKAEQEAAAREVHERYFLNN